MAITVIVPSARPDGGELGRVTFDAPRIVLGRGEGCDVRLPDASVTARHATIRQRGAELVLVDEGSTNGTLVGRTRLLPQVPHLLRTGDRVRVGRVWLEIAIGPEPPSPGVSTRARALALDLLLDRLAEQGEDARPRVFVTSGPDSGKQLFIDGGAVLSVGRSKDAALVLEEPEASRRHAEISRRGETIVVRDLGSRAGTTLDGQPVDGERTWAPGQVLGIGSDELSLSFDALEELGALDRAPDERLGPAELAPPPLPEAPVDLDDAFDDEDAPTEGVHEALSATEPTPSPAPTSRRQRVTWGATDFAVVMLALGVFSLSAVGYVVLLR